MAYDINDPYRAMYDPETADLLFGPRKLDQFTAEEREVTARREKAKRLAQQQPEEEQRGVYRAPFGPDEDESLSDYARRLAIAASESDRGKYSECLKCRKGFRIGEGCRGPVLCSQRCLTKVLKADKNRARDRRRTGHHDSDLHR